jgi:hypothetical protein
MNKKLFGEKHLKDIIDNKEFTFNEEAYKGFEKIQNESKVVSRDRRYFYVLLLLGLVATAFCFYPSSKDDTSAFTDLLSAETKPTKYTDEKTITTDTDIIPKVENNIQRESSSSNASTSTSANSSASTSAAARSKSLNEATLTNSNLLNNRNLSTEFNTNKAATFTIALANSNSISGSESLNRISGNTVKSNALLSKPINKGFNISQLDSKLHYLPITNATLDELSVSVAKPPMIKVNNELKYFAAASLGRGNQENLPITGLVGLEKRVFRNISLSTGLGYRWNDVSNLASHRSSALQYNSTTNDFTHGSIEANQFNLLHIPLDLNLDLNSNHRISLSTYYDFLFLTRGTISSISEGQELERNTWIVEDGINRHIYGLGFKYGYGLNKKSKLSLSYNQNLNTVFTQASESLKLGNVALELKYFLK